MSQMLERASRALRNELLMRQGLQRQEGDTNEIAWSRAALLAALDPEDEALVEIVAMNIHGGEARVSGSPTISLQWPGAVAGWPMPYLDKDLYRQQARIVLAAIKSMALGERDAQ